MGVNFSPSIALVTAPTRLSGLLSKFGTKGSARFRLSSARALYLSDSDNAGVDLDEDSEFERYVEEDSLYNEAVKRVRSELEGLGYPVVNVPKNYLASYYFAMTEAIVVMGPDGLVANTGKYADDIPIIGVNPMPDRIDGVLLPFTIDEARKVTRRTLEGKAPTREVTLARVELSDGQSMLAFNDFFIGRATHVSSRYVLHAENRSETQSSSGLIVSTGAGSSGWMSSVYHMTCGFARSLGHDVRAKPNMNWNANALRWVVREPFLSRTTGVGFVTGEITNETPLRMESLMPEGGVIFSDGIESDFLEFNSGAIAEISIAPKKCKLVA